MVYEASIIVIANMELELEVSWKKCITKIRFQQFFFINNPCIIFNLVKVGQGGDRNSSGGDTVVR